MRDSVRPHSAGMGPIVRRLRSLMANRPLIRRISEGEQLDHSTALRVALLIEALDGLLITIGANDRDCRNALALHRDDSPAAVGGCETRIRDLRRRVDAGELGCP